MRQLFFIILSVAGGVLLFYSLGSAQNKSYEERLNQIAQDKANAQLGTISGQDKEELKKKELSHAYSYIPKENGFVVTKADQSPEAAYSEFRKKHQIPEYVGDDVVKKMLKQAPDDELKTEVVKVVEAEKLLHESYETFQKEKNKVKLDMTMASALGKKEKDTSASDLDQRIDIIGQKTGMVLQTSIQKLSKANLLGEDSGDRGPQYMASGGRVFPSLELEKDKDLLNIRQNVLAKVQKELMSLMAEAINQYYHKEEGATARENVQNKEQLLAFVRVEEKSNQREKMMAEKIQRLEIMLQRSAKETYMEGERIHLDQGALKDLRNQIAAMREEKMSYGQTLDKSALNKLYRQLEKSGALDPDKDVFRPGVAPGELSPEEDAQFVKDMDAWDKSKKDQGKPTSEILRSRDEQWMPGDTRESPGIRNPTEKTPEERERERQSQWPEGDPCRAGGC